MCPIQSMARKLNFQINDATIIDKVNAMLVLRPHLGPFNLNRDGILTILQAPKYAIGL